MVELENLILPSPDSDLARGIVTTGYPANDFLKLDVRLFESRFRD